MKPLKNYWAIFERGMVAKRETTRCQALQVVCSSQEKPVPFWGTVRLLLPTIPRQVVSSKVLWTNCAGITELDI
jgi:hypothetical protein